MIISVHVPRTAGNSFGLALEHRFGERLLSDYNNDRPDGLPVYTWPRRWRSRAWVRSHASDLTASYDAVHGHFTASKYFPILRRDLCIFLREPTDRTISNYRKDLSSAAFSRYDRYIAKLLTLSQYASLPTQSRIYAIYTNGLPMEQFAFVGITEEYEASLALFEGIFGVSLPKYHINVHLHAVRMRAAAGKPSEIPYQRQQEVPDDFSLRERKAVRAAQRANYVIYDEARRRFDALYSRHVR